MKKVVATIEARMSSSRLPGKVMLSINNQTILQHIVKRLKAVEGIDEIVIATTTEQSDDLIELFAKKENVVCFRGSQNNVLDRVLKAAIWRKADIIVQITADCPLIDPDVIKRCLNKFLTSEFAFVSNVVQRSFPDGMDVQVFNVETLSSSSQMTCDPEHLEHVSLHIRENPQLFPAFHLTSRSDEYWPSLGLTLDEAGDFLLIQSILDYFHSKSIEIPSCSQIIELIKSNPLLLEHNLHVKRKYKIND